MVAFGSESVFIGDVADLNELPVGCGVAVASLFQKFIVSFINLKFPQLANEKPT